MVAHAAAIGWTAISTEVAKQKRGGEAACCSATSWKNPLRQVQAHAGQIAAPEWSEAVYTENAADAIDRPLVAELQLSPERETNVRALFKKTSENPKILIVTDKLLTGYDAALLYCMCLDNRCATTCCCRRSRG